MKKELMALAMSLVTLFGICSSLSVSDDVPISANVQGYLTATFNYASLYYGDLTAGTSNNAAPNQAVGIYNVSMDTNQNYKVSASGTQFSDGTHTFAVSNLKMDTNSTAGNLALGSAVALSGSPQEVDTNMPNTDTDNFHGFWLSIPASQFAANYTSTVTITYAAV